MKSSKIVFFIKMLSILSEIEQNWFKNNVGEVFFMLYQFFYPKDKLIFIIFRWRTKLFNYIWLAWKWNKLQLCFYIKYKNWGNQHMMNDTIIFVFTYLIFINLGKGFNNGILKIYIFKVIYLKPRLKKIFENVYVVT